jgi:hypothetical protein
MDAGARLALLAEMWIRIPTGIEENEEDADVVLRSDGEKRVDTLLKAGGVLLPKQIVEENTHGVEAERLGPAEFEFDAFWIEGVRLPHFELVDGSGGNVVAADEPRLVRIPIVGFGFGPAGSGVCGRRLREICEIERQPKSKKNRATDQAASHRRHLSERK